MFQIVPNRATLSRMKEGTGRMGRKAGHGSSGAALAALCLCARLPLLRVLLLSLAMAPFPAMADGNDDNNICYAQFQGGNGKAAIDYCTRAIRSGDLAEPDLVAALINRGVAYKNAGDLKAAVSDYTLALKHAPRDALILANRANALREMGDLEGARGDIEEALRLDPGRGPSFYVRGLILEAMGDAEAARKDYLQALTLEPENRDYQDRILELDAKRVQGGQVQ